MISKWPLLTSLSLAASFLCNTEAFADDPDSCLTYKQWRKTHPTQTYAAYVGEAARLTMQAQGDSALALVKTPEEKASVGFDNNTRKQLASVMQFMAQHVTVSDTTEQNVASLTRDVVQAIFAKRASVAVNPEKDRHFWINYTYSVQRDCTFAQNVAALTEWIKGMSAGIRGMVGVSQPTAEYRVKR